MMITVTSDPEIRRFWLKFTHVFPRYTLKYSDVIQAAIQLLTLHSFFNAFALVALTKPYRETVRQWLRLGGTQLRIFATTSSVHPAGRRSTPSTTATAVQKAFVRRNTCL